jgi:hypothetical protein
MSRLAPWLLSFAEVFTDPGIGVATGGALVAYRSKANANVELRLPQQLGPLFGNQRLSYTAGNLAARLDLLAEVGGFAEPLRFAENAEMAMRLVPACLERGFLVGVVDKPLVTYHRDSSAWLTNRAAYERMRDAAEYILERHGNRMLSLFPRGYANYRGVAAINAARLGDMAVARRHLVAAQRADPLRWRGYLRLVLTFAPRLASLFWTRRHGNAYRIEDCGE